MIEEYVLNYLKSNGFNAYTEEQEDMEKDRILFYVENVTCENMIYSCDLNLEIYSDTLSNTVQLRDQVRDSIQAMADNIVIANVKLNDLKLETDTTKKRYRYFGTFNLTFYD